VIVSATSPTPSHDFSVFDRTRSITIDLYGTTATLSSITEQDALSDATKNMAIVGDEVVQFVTATQVAGFPNRWTISTLLDGRRGTEFAVGATLSDKRFVLVDGAVKYVPAQLTDIRSQFDYRAVTSGQSLGDAATVQFVWTGETLKPYSVANIRGTRDSAGSVLIEWSGRSRLGSGLISGTDVPMAEETERYEVDIMDTGDNVVRTIPVSGNGSHQAANLVGSIYPSAVSANTLNAATTPDIESLAYSAQELKSPGTYVEATLNAPGNNIAQLGLYESRFRERVGRNLSSSDGFQIYVQFTQTNTGGGILPGLQVYENGTLKYSSGSLGAITSPRVRILLSGTETRFYWDYTGTGGVPFYVSRIIPVFPLVATALVIGADVPKISNVFIGTVFNPSTIYSAEQQVQDFGSLQNPLLGQIAQVSAIVGRGQVWGFSI
jgi:hypothetical protein